MSADPAYIPLESARTKREDLSEDALAQRFSAKHGDNWRYVAAWGKWLEWSDGVWREEDTLRVFDLARAICREAKLDCDTPTRAASIASAQTVSAIERLARADRRHAAGVEDWDADSWLLNTPGHVVDLRTGARRPNARDDYCSKITAVAPGKDCDGWLRFLDRVTDRNDELIAFLQRMFGYCLTGSTREHALFFTFGTGANGKSVFTQTLAGVAGDYARSAPMETFVASHNDRHPTDLAGLRGARLVTSIETEEGRRWAESKLKALTGGDRISARFMRQDFFDYSPQFKLMIAGNHKPGIRNIDEAMRRRLHLIPFTVTIPPEERDQQLADKLRAEWPGILQWGIDGCLAWQAQGLNPPAIVRDATAAYFAEEDAVERWIADRCVTGPSYTSRTAALWESWRKWCGETGEYEGTQRRLVASLTSRPTLQLHPWREPGTGRAGWRGIQTIRQDVGEGWTDARD